MSHYRVREDLGSTMYINDRVFFRIVSEQEPMSPAVEIIVIITHISPSSGYSMVYVIFE